MGTVSFARDRPCGILLRSWPAEAHRKSGPDASRPLGVYGCVAGVREVGLVRALNDRRSGVGHTVGILPIDLDGGTPMGGKGGKLAA